MTREEIIKLARGLCTDFKCESDTMVDFCNSIIRELKQEPKTGHWIWCVGSHKCSNCEEYTCFSHKELLRYCPNCGAKMVEPQESEGI